MESKKAGRVHADFSVGRIEAGIRELWIGALAPGAPNLEGANVFSCRNLWLAEAPRMSPRNKEVDGFLKRAKQWKEEMIELRELLLASGLQEEWKWGKPCYCSDGKNIVIMQPFRPHLSLMFFEGAQLKDPSGLLKSQGKNTQSAMRIEILDVTYIRKESKKIKQLINDAIKLEPSGKKSSPSAQPPWPEELMTAFRGDSEFKKAFEALTPGRQRSYLIHFSDARQSKTRENRIARSKAAIFAGKGFNER